MFATRVFELHQKAHRAAFSWYIRKGAVPPVLTEILEATRSVETFAKYNPDWMNQPRAPRGQPDGGRWTGGGDGMTEPQQTEPRVQTVDARGQTEVISNVLPKIYVPDPTGKPVNKVNIFVGGAGDETAFGNVQNSSSMNKEVYGNNYYATHIDEDRGKINALIASLPKDQTVNLIGHSWGGQSATWAAVDNPGRIKILVTIDPVGRDHPAYSLIRQSVKLWINVNATGNPNSSVFDDIINGNLAAALGGAWNDDPDGHAHIHYPIPLDHGQFGSMMRTRPSSGKSPNEFLNGGK